jgi:hypothetical protein
MEAVKQQLVKELVTAYLAKNKILEWRDLLQGFRESYLEFGGLPWICASG